MATWAPDLWAAGLWADGLWAEAAIAPTVTTTTLADGQVGVAYSATLAATGDGPITWAVTVGTLPDGLSLDANTGDITGTPTTEIVAGFTVEATNAEGSDTQALTLTIAAAAVIVTSAGGDDAPHHPGWNRKRATLKRDRDREFTEQIRDIYRDLLGDPRTAEQAEQIVSAVTEAVQAKGESDAAREAALMARAGVLRRRADAMDAQALHAEIALRLLHQNLTDTREQDDFEAIEYLLGMVL